MTEGEEQFEGHFGSLEFERPKQFDVSGEEYHQTHEARCGT